MTIISMGRWVFSLRLRRHWNVSSARLKSTRITLMIGWSAQGNGSVWPEIKKSCKRYIACLVISALTWSIGFLGGDSAGLYLANLRNFLHAVLKGGPSGVHFTNRRIFFWNAV